jgi:hypothetical protein
VTPTWLIRDDILSRIEESGIVDRIRRFQSSALNRLFDEERLYRLCETDALADRTLFGLNEMFNTTHTAIWSDLDGAQPIDMYKRNLHRAYLDVMQDLLELENAKYDQSDIKAQVRYSLQRIMTKTARASGGSPREVHLADVHARVQEILDVD